MPTWWEQWRRRGQPTDVTAQLGTCPHVDPPTVQSWLEEQVRSKGDETGWEYLAILDREDGGYRIETSESPGKVDHSDTVEQMFQDPGRALVLIHNHTASRDPQIVRLGVPSQEDISLLGRASVGETVVLGGNGQRCVTRLTPGVEARKGRENVEEPLIEWLRNARDRIVKRSRENPSPASGKFSSEQQSYIDICYAIAEAASRAGFVNHARSGRYPAASKRLEDLIDAVMDVPIRLHEKLGLAQDLESSPYRHRTFEVPLSARKPAESGTVLGPVAEEAAKFRPRTPEEPDKDRGRGQPQQEPKKRER